MILGITLRRAQLAVGSQQGAQIWGAQIWKEHLAKNIWFQQIQHDPTILDRLK